MSKLPVITLLLLLAFPDPAASAEYDILRLQLSDLLPESKPADVHLDRRGFFWLSVGRRVYRYDGYSLREIYRGDSDPNPGSLSNTRKLFAESPNGSIWFIDGARKLRKYSPKEHTFVRAERLAKELDADVSIFSIAHDGDSSLWVLLDDGKVAVFDTRKGELLTNIESSRYLGPEDMISNIETLANGEAWIMSSMGVLLLCSRQSQSCQSMTMAELLPNGSQKVFYNIKALSNQTLAISTESNGAFIVDTAAKTAMPISRMLAGKKSQIEEEHVWDLHVSPSGDLWVATDSGLFGPGGGSELVEYFSADSRHHHLFVNNFEPLNDKSFVAMSFAEVLLVREKLFESYTEADGLVSSVTTGFAQAKGGTVYVSSVQGMSIFDADTRRIVSIEDHTPGVDLIDRRVMTILATEEGILFGGYLGGLRYIDTVSGEVVVPTPQSSELSAISSIAKIDANLLLIGTPADGLIAANSSGVSISNLLHPDLSSSMAGRFAHKILKTKTGQIFVATDRGMLELRINPDKTISTTDNFLHLDGEEIYDIFMSSSNTLWVGTYQNGIYRSISDLRSGELKLEKVVPSPALPDDTINSIQEDEFGMLWISTNQGIVRLNPVTDSINVYDRSDGLVANEYILGAKLKDEQGALYFGGTDGFDRFYPSKFVELRSPPPLRLTEILIQRKPVSYDPTHLEVPALVLDHNDHSLDVEFSTMDIISPGRSRYKYKLENFDDDWVDIGTRNSATFTSLPAGKYVLRVIGADSKGVWNYDGITLPVRVLPAPWLTWWAFTSYALLILGFVVLVKRSYDTYLQKVAATQEAEQMKITATLVMDDLQDQLEVENRLVDNLRKHATSTFEMVDEFLTMELEELYGEEIDVPLGRVRERLNCLKALEAAVYFLGDQLKVNFRDAVDRCFAEVVKAHPHPSAELVLANDCSEELVAIDIAAPLLLLAHELILNSVTHAYPDSVGVECIEIKFKSEGANYLFAYEDAGCGLPNSIDPATPTTVGMDLIARIITRLGATLEVERERGATFRATIPGEEA